MNKIICILFFMTLSFSILAHEDTPIKLKANGSLVGLPKQYAPASFDKTSFTLSIGEISIRIPECIKAHFKEYEDYEISFSASWYHDPGLLPFYIHMYVATGKEPYGYHILFNLQTLEILEISKSEVVIKGNNVHQYYDHELELSEECQNEISSSIKKK